MSASDPLDERLYLGAYALCLEAGRLLLCRISQGYPDAGRWTLPGGGLAWGEAPEAGMRRELLEETGLEPQRVEGVAAVYSKTYGAHETREGSALQHVGIIYRVGGLRGTLRAELDESTDLCAWVTRAEAEALPLVPLAAFAHRLAWPEAAGG